MLTFAPTTPTPHLEPGTGTAAGTELAPAKQTAQFSTGGTWVSSSVGGMKECRGRAGRQWKLSGCATAFGMAGNSLWAGHKL